MSWKKVKLKQILKQYRIEHLVQDNVDYKQVTISKYDGVTFRGTKMGREIGRKRQFQIDLKKFPNTLMFVRQGVQDGSIGIAPIEVDGCIATENMPMFSIEGINLEYLKFILKSPYFYDELNKIQTTGSAQKSIHEREILEIEIPFPDIEEQEDIVHQLSRGKNNLLEISIELNHQLTLIKKLRQQLLQDAVQGKLVDQNLNDEPASELLKKIKAEKQKLIAEKKLKKEKVLASIKPKEIPYEIPENWMWCRLGDLSLFSAAGSSFKCEEVPVSNGEWGVIKVSAVSWDVFLEEKNKVYSKTQPDDISAKINIGDFLISRANTSELVGKSVVVKNISKNLLLSDKTIRFRFSDFVSTDYINLCNNFTKHARGYYALMGTGSSPSMKNITREHMRNLLIPLPPLAEQNRIVQKLDELMQYCNDLETSIKQSETQNEKLLQQVLREALRKEPVEA